MTGIARSILGGGATALLAVALVPVAAASERAPAIEEVSRVAPGRSLPARDLYGVVPLVSDGSLKAPFGDANLSQPWGLALTGSGLWWVANNGTDSATIYNGEGVAQSLVVSLPGGAAPTGIAFNASERFIVHDGANEGPARFIFATEDGRIFGWGPAVSPPGPTQDAVLALDRPASGPVYMGLTLASTGAGNRLYLTDFRNATVDVFDDGFVPIELGESAFVDPGIPRGYAPLGIRSIQGRIVVTFALQDATAEDAVPGPGLGFVSAFDTDGVFLGRLGTRGLLNAPWGLALAPQEFGRFGGDLLVGNFGDGEILAFRVTDDLRQAKPAGVLHGSCGRVLVIDGLRAIEFGNGAAFAPRDALFFTAGSGGKRHGLFGRIESRPAQPADCGGFHAAEP